MSHTGHFELFNFKLEISNFYVYRILLRLHFEIFIWTFQNFAGWALTDGQHRPKAGEHRPKAGKKKKTHEVGLFFLVPTSFQWCFITKRVNRLFPAQ